jgi:hypothetical protein
LFGPIGIDLNAIARSGYAMKQLSECHSVANAGVERRKSLGKAQPILESFGLGNWQREKA